MTCKKYLLFSVLISLLLILHTGCDLTGSENDKKLEVTIGSAYQGGIVIHILQEGDPYYIEGETHGLIVSTEDLSDGIQWNNGSFTATGADGLEAGTGPSNTAAIVGAQGDGSYAAKLCDDYTNPDTGTGAFSDWYLPSREELNQIFLNETALGGLGDGGYWSSSELSDAWAYAQTGGSIHSSYKSDEKRVRAVRDF